MGSNFSAEVDPDHLPSHRVYRLPHIREKDRFSVKADQQFSSQYDPTVDKVMDILYINLVP